MKKFTIAAIILSICLMFAGCTAASNDISTEAPTSETTETTETSIPEETEGSLSEIPNAKEFPEIEWPTFGAATKIPTPEWSNCGSILIDSETHLWVQVGYSTLDDYNAYVKACQEMGYTEDYYNVAGYMYYGANTDDYGVQLTYNQTDHYIAIQVTACASEWDKWWEEESEASIEE